MLTIDGISEDGDFAIVNTSTARTTVLRSVNYKLDVQHLTTDACVLNVPKQGTFIAGISTRIKFILRFADAWLGAPSPSTTRSKTLQHSPIKPGL